jgi:hypothetical protein
MLPVPQEFGLLNSQISGPACEHANPLLKPKPTDAHTPGPARHTPERHPKTTGTKPLVDGHGVLSPQLSNFRFWMLVSLLHAQLVAQLQANFGGVVQ